MDSPDSRYADRAPQVTTDDPAPRLTAAQIKAAAKALAKNTAHNPRIRARRAVQAALRSGIANPLNIGLPANAAILPPQHMCWSSAGHGHGVLGATLHQVRAIMAQGFRVLLIDTSAPDGFAWTSAFTPEEAMTITENPDQPGWEQTSSPLIEPAFFDAPDGRSLIVQSVRVRRNSTDTEAERLSLRGLLHLVRAASAHDDIVVVMITDWIIAASVAVGQARQTGMRLLVASHHDSPWGWRDGSPVGMLMMGGTGGAKLMAHDFGDLKQGEARICLNAPDKPAHVQTFRYGYAPLRPATAPCLPAHLQSAMDRLEATLSADRPAQTHMQRLECVARASGYRSWHAAQGAHR